VCGEHTGLVVEIGPGRGALTEHLLDHADRVIAIELDPGLNAYLKERWRDEPRLEIIEGDALDQDWSRWGTGVLAGNLPYYVASAIVSRYVKAPGSLSQAVFLIQKEVAERVTVQPGNREFGYFSVECQFLAHVDYLFTVPPGSFRPPPKVDSAVIRLRPKTDCLGLVDDRDRFLEFVARCFRQKRKTLRNNLSGLFERERLEAQPDMSRRAEQLSVAEFIALYRKLVLGE
jgi:16S rRNA (adenine1518-N6/adenine1519-N6)-dimethyltransferase